MSSRNEDRAWAAGFFDGEGCFHLTRQGGAVATMSQVDREVLDRFCRIVECGGVYGPQSGGANANRQPFFIWRVGSRADFDKVVAVLWPWLGTIKRAAATRVAEGAGPGGNAQARKTHCPRGHPYDEVNTRWVKTSSGSGRARQCRACTRERQKATWIAILERRKAVA